MPTPADGERRAFAEGKEKAEITARLGEHDRHFLDLNGSIDKMTSAVDRVEGRLAKIEAREQSLAAVAEATRDAVKKHGEAQITNRTFTIGVLGVIVAVGGLFVAVSPPG